MDDKLDDSEQRNRLWQHRLFLTLNVGLMRTLCGDWIKLCVGRVSEADQNEPAHTSVFSGI
jgi:hypothetical protein